jgi:hypothetical protein
MLLCSPIALRISRASRLFPEKRVSEFLICIVLRRPPPATDGICGRHTPPRSDLSPRSEPRLRRCPLARGFLAPASRRVADARGHCHRLPKPLPSNSPPATLRCGGGSLGAATRGACRDATALLVAAGEQEEFRPLWKAGNPSHWLDLLGSHRVLGYASGEIGAPQKVRSAEYHFIPSLHFLFRYPTD